jgi:septum formation protein
MSEPSIRRLFVLASSSPRRRELLGIGGFMFSTVRVDVDESVLPDEAPRDYVRRVSILKARSAPPLLQGTPLVIAADTVVVDEGDILGKPQSVQQAEDMLKQLRGRSHQVMTGLAVLDMVTGRIETETATTDVPMREYTDEEIAAYISTGDPFDKAGGYAIQNEVFRPAKTRTGCYANVVGLPLCHLLKVLRRMEVHVPQDIPYLCQTAHDYECGVFSTILER